MALRDLVVTLHAAAPSYRTAPICRRWRSDTAGRRKMSGIPALPEGTAEEDAPRPPQGTGGQR